MSKPHRTDFTFEPDDSERLSNLVGPLDEHLRQIELRLGVEIANRGNVFRVSGEERPVQLASRLLHRLYALTEDNTLTAAQINLHLQESGIEAIIDEDASSAQEVTVKVKRGTIRGRGPNQARYLHAIATHDINFG
ncbi:MAG: phosphate starvation-inducible protein PhoH, partial [Dokdonella sp.]|nr:phosphate starvation-inducible protein PhoH [Dokdonella sp.]